jgi:integrase
MAQKITTDCGYVGQRKRDGKWFARLTWTDETTGKRIDRTKFGRDRAHAERLLTALIAESNGEALESPLSAFSEAGQGTASTLTFRQLAQAYSDHKVTAPVYRNGRKISGMRSERTVRIRIAVLVAHFGDVPVSNITAASVEKFKNARLNTPTKYDTERNIASVHRELETLRAILRFARNEGIISASPFERASTPIVSKAFETRRTRTLSEAEETRLLAACDSPKRERLIPVIIAAIDTGARKGELLALRWSDVNNSQDLITLRSEMTKTQQTRTVPLSNRLYKALYDMAVERAGGQYLRGLPKDDGLVFGLTKFQNGWDAACEDAKITDLRFHDLRATFITRRIEQGMPVELVAQLSGHSDVATLYRRYLRKTASALDWAKRLLDSQYTEDYPEE